MRRLPDRAAPARAAAVSGNLRNGQAELGLLEGDMKKLVALSPLPFLPIFLLPTMEISAQDAEFMGVVKTKVYRQSGPEAIGPEDMPGEKPFVLDAFADASEPNSLTSATLDRPSGADVPLSAEDGGEEFFFDQKFNTLAELDASFANGSYALKLVGLSDGARTVPLSLTGDTYPDPPKFADYNAAQQIDHSTATTFTWSSIAGGTTDTWVFFEIEDQDGDAVFETPFPGEDGALDGTSTSVEVPAGTLSEGSSYAVRLDIVELVDENETYATAIAGYQAVLKMGIQTLGPDEEAPTLQDSFPFYGEEEIVAKSVVTFVFSETMDQTVAPGEAISWTGIPEPGSFSYQWSPDGQTLFCHYTPGLPTSATIQWVLNPDGSAAKLRDSAGNNLPDNNHQGDFFTSSVSNLEAPDASLLELFKVRGFSQTSDASPAPGDHFFGLFSSLSGISSVSSIDLDIPVLGLTPDFGEFEFDHRAFDTENSFASKGELDAAYPKGTYAVTLHAFNDGKKTVNLNLSTDTYPNAPKVQEFAAVQNWDSTKAITLRWDAMQGGTASDSICLFIEGDNEVFFETPCFGEAGALDGTATEITIPANSLPPGRTLIAELAFVSFESNDFSQYPDVRLVSGFGSITEFEVQTAGNPFQPILEVSHDGDRASIKVTGERGLLYDLRSSPDLQEWSYATTLWLGNDPQGFMASSSFDSTGSAKRFYRVEPSSGE
ncbi:hypothetical protein N8528_02295 [Akkermansiaceae bacterium]|nr:hypothetical protein [Akkermansiaceae bacterium]